MSHVRAAAAASALSVLAVAQLAAAEVKLQTVISPRKVEIGDQFSAQVLITSNGHDTVSEPDLKLPPAVRSFGQSVSRGSSVSITWMLVASRAGKFKIGPASVATANGRVSDKAVTIEVVAQGTLSNKQPPLGGQPLNPFSILRGFGGTGFPNMPGFPGFPDQEQAPELPALPEEFKVEHAPDQVAFLRATATPTKVVVGEQVTLSGYAYGGRGEFGHTFFGEATRDDFLAVSIGDDDDARLLPFELDGKRWYVRKVASTALFPLKAGKLRVGSMRIGFAGPGYSDSPQGLSRKSHAIDIEVVEPPLQGRPPGYHLGDVGTFSLSAVVQPREVPVEGSISVIAKLEGTGNLPFTLLVPEQSGVHFLEPQLVEQIAPRRGEPTGFRTFTYVVELTRPGNIDLGEITLPFYDAKARAYGVARAALGRVVVTGTAKPVTANSKSGSSGPSLKGLLSPPAKMSATAHARSSYLPSRAYYWALLFGLPLSTLLGFALSDLAKLLRRRLSERRGSLASALDDALAQLAQAARADDAAASAGAAERALFLAIEKATGLKGRGVLKAQLAEALANSDVPRDVAQQTAALLGQCDELRFTDAGRQLVTFAAEVRETCQKLNQRKAAPATGGAT